MIERCCEPRSVYLYFVTGANRNASWIWGAGALCVLLLPLFAGRSFFKMLQERGEDCLVAITQVEAEPKMTPNTLHFVLY